MRRSRTREAAFVGRYTGGVRTLTWVLMCGGLIGCSEEPTQLMAVLDTDFPVPVAMDSLELQGQIDGRAQQSREYALAGAGALDLPIVVGIVPAEDKNAPVRLTLIGKVSGVEVLSRTVLTAFDEGRIRRVDLTLLTECRRDACESSPCQGCGTSSIDPSDLPIWPSGPMDSGADGGVDGDGGGDADSSQPQLSCTVGGPIDPAPEPALDLCSNGGGELVTDMMARNPATLMRPDPGAFVIDPAFGTRIRRVTDVGASMGRSVIDTRAFQAVWNADESLLMAQGIDGEFLVFDGQSYAPLGGFSLATNDSATVQWDRRDPGLVLYTRGPELRSYRPCDDTHELIHRFTECGGLPVQLSPTWSRHGDVLGLSCNDLALVYERTSGRITTEPLMDGELPQVSPDGTVVVIGARTYNSQLGFQYTLDIADPEASHVLLESADGVQRLPQVTEMVSPAQLPATALASFDLTDGTRTDILPAPWPLPTQSGMDASARRQGWSIVSYGERIGEALSTEFVLARVADGRLCRVAHHRNTQMTADVSPAISPTGTRIAFTSDWDNPTRADVYVLELPTWSR